MANLINKDVKALFNKGKGKKLKEGYLGQTLQDFLDDCIDYYVIDKIYIYGEDDIVYEGSIDDIPYDMLNAEFMECDTYMNGRSKVVVNVDSSEEYGIGTYYNTLDDFLEDCNSELLEVYDLNTGETLFNGDKEDCPDDVRDLIFASYDSPNELSVNLSDYEGDSYEEDDDEEFEEDYFTKKGVKGIKKSQKYPELAKYYDPYMGNYDIPKRVFNEVSADVIAFLRKNPKYGLEIGTKEQGYEEDTVFIVAPDNLDESKVNEDISPLAKKMGAKFLPPKDYGMKKKKPRYVYEVYYYDTPDCNGDPIYRKFSSRKAQEEWYEKHKDDPDKFDMYAYGEASIYEGLNEVYDTNERVKELKAIQKTRALTDEEAEELAYCENEVDSRDAECRYLNGESLGEAREKYGVVTTYKGYTIHNTPSCYVITNPNGTTVAQTKWGIPVAKAMIDGMIADKGIQATESIEDEFKVGDEWDWQDGDFVVITSIDGDNITYRTYGDMKDTMAKDEFKDMISTGRKAINGQNPYYEYSLDNPNFIFNESKDTMIELHYPTLMVQKYTDNGVEKKEIEYYYEVPREKVIDALFHILDGKHLLDDYNAEDAVAYVENEFDNLVSKYEKELNDVFEDSAKDEVENTKDLQEDTVKQGNKWVNKGNKGDTHGEFKTKKEADKQRKAMFVNKKPNAKWGN